MSQNLPDFIFPIRVYWEDTDGQGVVFYANYIKFFERARTEWLRALGFSQERLRLEAGGVFVVSETKARYLRSARLDDWLQVTVQVAELQRSSLIFKQQIWRENVVITEGEIRVVWVSQELATGEFRPRRIPDFILQAIPPNP